ncbi:MAG: SDR family NAD(P)-dependent oxidoreductase [Deinococcales bacterium]
MQVVTEGDTPPAVLVTGASTGIGRAVALDLARRGFQVFAGVRREASAEGLRQDATAVGTAKGGGLTPVLFDVTDKAAIDGAASVIEDRTGAAGLHAVVNNAGVVVAGPLEFLPLEDLRLQMEVNVVGQIAVTQAMLPLLRRAREVQLGAGPASGIAQSPAVGVVEATAAGTRPSAPLFSGSTGRIVFVGSISGLVSSRLLGAYAASKFAIEALGDAFRLELEPWGLQVSIVEPGRVRTPIWRKSLGAGEARLARMPDEARELYADAIRVVAHGVSDVDSAGIAPDGVARAVAHALTAARARTRYRVGIDARVVAWMRGVLPDRVMDRFLISVRR